MRSRNLSGSACILREDGLKINFSVAHAVHVKSKDWGNFALFREWPTELLVIFLIIPMPG
jgi:hypothetical protein